MLAWIFQQTLTNIWIHVARTQTVTRGWVLVGGEATKVVMHVAVHLSERRCVYWEAARRLLRCVAPQVIWRTHPTQDQRTVHIPNPHLHTSHTKPTPHIQHPHTAHTTHTHTTHIQGYTWWMQFLLSLLHRCHMWASVDLFRMHPTAMHRTKKEKNSLTKAH